MKELAGVKVEFHPLPTAAVALYGTIASVTFAILDDSLTEEERCITRIRIAEHHATHPNETLVLTEKEILMPQDN